MSTYVYNLLLTPLDGKQNVVANVSDTEIGYLDGVTANIQVQLNQKYDIASTYNKGEIDNRINLDKHRVKCAVLEFSDVKKFSNLFTLKLRIASLCTNGKDGVPSMLLH